MENIIWTTSKNKRTQGGYRAHWTNLHGYRLVVSVDAGWRDEDDLGPDQPSAFVVNRRGSQEASGYTATLDEAKQEAVRVAQLLHAAGSTSGRTALADVVSMLRREACAGKTSYDILAGIRNRVAFLNLERA